MGKRENLSIITKRKLSWGNSDGKCCICGQNIGFFEETGFIGEFAHIEDLQEATDRYNPDKTIEERNSQENIIILCPTCHTRIDKNSKEYSVDKLKEIKKEYENNIKLAKEYANVDLYKKFSLICIGLMNRCKEKKVEERFSSIVVEEKISRNSLEEINDQIEFYMQYIPVFKEYLSTLSQVERIELRHNIIELYLEEVKKDINNVERFANLIRTITGNNLINATAAGIIICNYFEECDVFEI